MINSTLLKKIFLIFVGIFGETSSLIFIYFIKYRTHNLTLEDVNIFYTGNLINLIISGLLILFLILNLFRVNKLKFVEIQVYLNSLFLSVLLLLILVILLSRDFYVLSMLKSSEYELEKVISVLLWIIFIVVKLFSLNYLVLRFFSFKRGLLPKNLILIAFTFVVIILVAFVKIYTISKTGDEYQIKKGERFNALVVLGAAVWKGNIPSPVYEGRLKTSAELLTHGYSDKIILTGSNAPFELSEAEVGKIYLQKQGIDTSKIETEEKTTSTIDQIHFIKRELIEKRNYKKILIISDAFHLPRVIEISKFLSIEIKVARSNLRFEFMNNLWYRIRESVLLSIFWLFAV